MSRDKAVIIGTILFFVLSLLDGALTLWGLGLGAIEEVNPIMRRLIEKSPIVFIAVKVPIPVMLGFIFWWIRDRSRRFVYCSLELLLIVYSMVMMLHVYWLVFFE